MQTTSFFVLQYPNPMTSITGGGGSDFPSSQILASFKQLSFPLVFLRMRVFVSRHI